ncbi:hypothetical protein QBC34DRAFT_415566 [Podospora aff. communis PSN243]|uniref:Transmembrane and coiled-coil domain-containing protein n=1 Tax=Podospora aff. communis PSN243 TaxID=3040156 RepID=A0AAV9GA55_9PEZI|nr:hypothetical protein QBC34DRAFT_415566 [Podospora aff. communis PSN243]
MAPKASDPRQVLLVLNLAKRKALYVLIDEITRWMRSQFELRPGEERQFPPNAALAKIQRDALVHFDTWRRDVLAKIKEVLSVPDDAKIVDERRKRTDRMAQRRVEILAAAENLIDFDGSGGNSEKLEAERAAAVARLQASYHAIPTRLATISVEDREETLSCILLILLSTGRYSAESRALLVYMASALELPLSTLNSEEIEIATSLAESGAEAERQQKSSSMSAEAEAEKRKQDGQASRYWKVGLASVAGAALIGVTGGLAAPVVAGAIGGIMGSVGLGGVASFLGIFWMNGALVGTLFGAFGAKMTGEAVDQYAKEVQDFRFIPLKEGRAHNNNAETSRRLRVSIGVNGWLTSEDDIVKPWKHVGDDSEVFALRYEVKSLLGLGASLEDLVTSYAWKLVRMEILKRTVLVTLWSALWPVTLISMASKIDNPFSLARNRSDKAGKILADALINRVQGERPVTLVGYSLGSRVIYACLRSLAERRAFGLIDNVVLIGSPVPSNRDHWLLMKTMVAGKVYNVYSENDYLLAFLYRATSIQLGVAGLQEIKNIEGVKNLNLSSEVQGHLRYPSLIDQILARCDFPMGKGAALGPIEHDEDEVVLRDEGHERAGTLIELDFLNPEPPPPAMETQPGRPPNPNPPPQQQPASSEQRRQRATVVRAATSSVPANSPDPLGIQDPLSGPPPPYQPRSITVPVLPSRSQRSAPPQISPRGGVQGHQKSLSGEHPNLKYSGTARQMALAPKPMPQLRDDVPLSSQSHSTVGMPSSSFSLPLRGDVSQPKPLTAIEQKEIDHEDDSDEDGGFAIQMVDNDDDLECVDPTPIED